MYQEQEHQRHNSSTSSSSSRNGYHHQQQQQNGGFQYQNGYQTNGYYHQHHNNGGEKLRFVDHSRMWHEQFADEENPEQFSSVFNDQRPPSSNGREFRPQSQQSSMWTTPTTNSQSYAADPSSTPRRPFNGNITYHQLHLHDSSSSTNGGGSGRSNGRRRSSNSNASNGTSGSRRPSLMETIENEIDLSSSMETDENAAPNNDRPRRHHRQTVINGKTRQQATASYRRFSRALTNGGGVLNDKINGAEYNSSDDSASIINGHCNGGGASNGGALAQLHRSNSERHQNGGKPTSNSVSSGFPPRKTLIDTFVDRNDEYWRTRVTIKMDVAHTDHSHIIGKQGRNTQTVMKDTCCHIHFPDANRNPEMEKSNMVTIAGSLLQVDKARQSIRSLAPLVITLEIKNISEEAQTIAHDPLIRELAVKHGLSILVRTNRSSGMPFFVVRGSVHQSEAINLSVTRLQEHFKNTAMCALAIDVLHPQQGSVIGPDGANIHLISQITGATIHYPRDETRQATTFFVRGAIGAILLARQYIVGSLPMALVFEVNRDDRTLDADELCKYRDQGILVGMRVGRNGQSLVLVVKAQERQASQVYAIRRELVGDMFPDEPEVVANDFLFMKDFPGCGYIPSPTFEAPFVPGNERFTFTVVNPAAAALPYSPLSAPWHSNGFAQGNFDFPPITVQVQSDPSTVPSTAMTSFSSCNLPSTADTSFDTTIATVDTSMNELHTANDVDQELREGGSSPANSTSDPLPDIAPLACSLIEAKKKIQTDKRCSKNAEAKKTNGIIITEYDRQLDLAAKAMAEKAVSGVPRFPTAHWSGMGFSRSMPSAAVPLSPTLSSSSDSSTSSTLSASCTVSSAEDMVTQMCDVDEDGATKPKKPKPNEDDSHINGIWDANKLACWTMTPMDKMNGLNASNFFEDSDTTFEGMTINFKDNMTKILYEMHMLKYLDLFMNQEIDVATFLTMSEMDLKELGIATFGARRKFMSAIGQLKEIQRKSK